MISYKQQIKNANDILELYFLKLIQNEKDLQNKIRYFEEELFAFLNIRSALGQKEFWIELAKDKKFSPLAIKKMECSTCPPGEFKTAMTKAYGIRYYHTPEMEKARKCYWENFRNNHETNDGE